MKNETVRQLLCLREELLAVNTQEDKIDAIRKYPDLKDILSVIYDPDYKIHVTSKSILKYVKEGKTPDTQMFEGDTTTLLKLFDTLNKKIISGDVALGACYLFISRYEKNLDITLLLLKVFDKNLKCGISYKTIEKAFDVKIKKFSVALANIYDPKKVDFDKDEWYISRKLDGVRCIIVKDENGVKLYSRTGKEFTTLDKIKDEIKNNFIGNFFVLDGEVCIMNDGVEDFKAVVSEIKRKNHTIENPVFYAFDFLDTDAFKHNKDFKSFDYKIDILNSFFNYSTHLKHVKVLKQQKVLSLQELEERILTIPKGWEGYMLRKNAPTVMKRSNNLLKVKAFKYKTFVVTGVQTGKKLINSIERDCCTAFEIKYAGSTVSIGSGISDLQRIKWYKYPENLIGKTVMIKYFEESFNKNGGKSLRFPVLHKLL